MIDALRTCRDAGLDVPIAPAVERALIYYRRNLFMVDGAPKYYSDKLYPIDASCAAQGIQTFALASADDPAHLDHAWAVLSWTLRNLRRRDGLFIFQRRRFWTNRTPHTRWAQATMFLAMTHLLCASERASDAASQGSGP